MAAGTSFIGRGLWLSLQPQLDHTYHTSGQLLLAEALWLLTFRSSHLWLRGGVEETEVKELPTVVWGLRNMSLLILSNKKKKNLILLWMDSGCFLHPFRGKEEKAQVEG